MTSDADSRPIELRLRDIGQLFNSFDPLPFRERDLDPAVEAYLVDWAREIPPKQRLEILIHVPAAEALHKDAAHVGEAVSNYFAYRAEAKDRELRELFRIGRGAAAIGVAVLAACTLAGRALGAVVGSEGFGRFLQEGLIIVGWVANWRPIEIFLYDWAPLVRQRRLFRRLEHAAIRLVAT